MPSYCVYMGQGISVANLGNDELVTGVGNPGDALQSCSAIVLGNTANGAAGLYHFPAGDIDDDLASQGILMAMQGNIAPDVAYIGMGISPFQHAVINPGMSFGANQTADEHATLRAFVLRLIPFAGKLKTIYAVSGVITVGLANGQFVVGKDTPLAITNLRNAAAGNYPNYTLYG